MISILAPWILLSLVVGYFGRDSRGGFWGIFFFSLLFTPLIGGLAVLLAGPSGRARTAEARQRMAATRPASARPATRLSQLTAVAAWRSLILSWVVVILLFAAAFVFSEATGSSLEGFKSALQISLDAGTFRITGTDLGNGSAATRVLIGLEGFLVLGLMALQVARFVTQKQDRAVRQMRSDSQDNVQRLEELQATLRAQQASLDHLRSVSDQSKAAHPVIIEHQG